MINNMGCSMYIYDVVDCCYLKHMYSSVVMSIIITIITLICYG